MPETVIILPPESVAKKVAAVPGNDDGLVYAGRLICKVFILQLATSAVLPAFVPLSILSLF
jgi:hypothetical protein